MAPVNPDKKNNVLNIWGNEKTMNLNNMILTNILSSHYFKVNLYQLKTYHEVIDEIYYHVIHLEPWEKGSRKTSGQTGMCGGVRGVGAGGIVSTAFCILYKLFTLKLTRKQVVGLLTHCDSPYIRALGFMYIRYTQHPGDLWDWYEAYLDDEEEVDVKAGGGQMMTIGEMLRHFLSKLEWFSTLFPRIPVPIQKDIEKKLSTCKPPPKAVGVAVVEVAEGDPNAMEEVLEEGVVGVEETAEDTNKTCRSSISKEKAMKDKADVAEEIARERDRQRREKTPVRLHHHHRSRADYKDRTKNSSHVHVRSRSQSRSRERRHHRTDKYERHPSNHPEKSKSSSHRSRSRSSERRRNRKHKSSHH